jgi:hypothetical protein
LSSSLIPATNDSAAQQSNALQPEVASSISRLPLVFEPNHGQAPPGARFVSRTGKYTLLLTADQAILVLPQAGSSSDKGSARRLLHLELIGAQSEPSMEGIDQLPGKSNYFIGRDSANWRTNIPQYAKVEYRSAYPGIDLVFYGNQDELEYDFRVAAGADPTLIGFWVDGADRMEIDSSGDLLVHFDKEIVRLQKPNVYQEAHNVRRELKATFELRGKNEVGFDLGPYDKKVPLVIDPVLSYSTLIQPNNDTEAEAIAVDSTGHAYVTGRTFATNYPTVSAFQPTNHGTTNAFVTKLSPGGGQIRDARTARRVPSGQLFRGRCNRISPNPSTRAPNPILILDCPGRGGRQFGVRFIQRNYPRGTHGEENDPDVGPDGRASRGSRFPEIQADSVGCACVCVSAAS